MGKVGRHLSIGLVAVALLLAVSRVIADCPKTEAWGPTLGDPPNQATCYCFPSEVGCSNNNVESDCTNTKKSLTGKFCCHNAPNGQMTECISQSGDLADCDQDATCKWDPDHSHCDETLGGKHPQHTSVTVDCAS